MELSSVGIQLDMISDLPKSTTFINTNTTMTPANSILLAYGYSYVNQTSITSYYLDTFKIPFSVHEKTWYSIETVLSGGQYLAVAIDNTQVFNVSLSKYYIGSASVIPTTGSFGFGGWQDQSSYIRNVAVYDTANSTLIYNNSMTHSSILGEYGVHQNYNALCLDGAKRDRLPWLGDLIHTSQIVASSIARFDMLRCTLQWFLDWQTSDGLFPFAAPSIGYSPGVASQTWSGGPVIDLYAIELSDYQTLGLIAFCNYVEKSNDIEFAQSAWPQWELQIEWLLSKINETTGLISYEGFTILGPADGGAVSSCSLLRALNQVANIAAAINQTASASTYQTAARKLADAIDATLWNDNLGIYSLSTKSPDDYSVAGLAFCLTSGIANATQSSRSISALSALKLGPGYKDSTQVNSSDPTVNISPFTNGLLLDAMLQVSRFENSTNSSKLSLDLMESLWGAMLASSLTSSGASWEYVSQTGTPGLGLFTSLSHPWGGAPTYLLTNYVAGVRQAEGVHGYGYRNWIVDPTVGLKMGLKMAKAVVVTDFSGNEKLEVEWELEAQELRVRVKAPRGTTGVLMGLGDIGNFGAKRVQGEIVVYNVTLTWP